MFLIGSVSVQVVSSLTLGFIMANSKKEAYVRSIKDLSVTARRVAEQVCGRLVYYYSETFKKGTSKSVAVIVDADALRSVLVLEAWSAADQAHMQKNLFVLSGQVVCLSNLKVQSRGRSLVFLIVISKWLMTSTRK